MESESKKWATTEAVAHFFRLHYESVFCKKNCNKGKVFKKSSKTMTTQ